MSRLFVLFLLGACSNSIGPSKEGTADSNPIEYRQPPTPKQGTSTAPGCDGVAVRGECQKGEAVYCDIDRNRLRRVKCETLGQSCAIDISRGAICKFFDLEEGSKSSPCADTGVSETGFCTPEGAAVFCDVSEGTPVTKNWKCADAGKNCAIGQEGCATGAYCCNPNDQPQGNEGDDCGSYDFEGECVGDVATWCDPADGLQQETCGEVNKRCVDDETSCAIGAYCCGTTADATPEQILCDTLGLEGTCNAEKTVASYCISDDVINDTCANGQMCEEDTCALGAACCTPSAQPDNECTTLGYKGICKDINTVRFCAGTEDVDIIEAICPDAKECIVDETGDAHCELVSNPCDTLDLVGICDNNVLQYCLGNDFKEIDCSLTSKTCRPAASSCLQGYANCCD